MAFSTLIECDPSALELFFVNILWFCEICFYCWAYRLRWLGYAMPGVLFPLATCPSCGDGLFVWLYFLPLLFGEPRSHPAFNFRITVVCIWKWVLNVTHKIEHFVDFVQLQRVVLQILLRSLENFSIFVRIIRLVLKFWTYMVFKSLSLAWSDLFFRSDISYNVW